MRFGVSVPNFGRFGNPGYFAQLASLVEKSGWDGLFIWDHMLVWDGNEVHDPWMLMVLAAVRTERILLGPMVTPLPRRRPWQVARQAATLDHISGGRVMLGVGIGAPEDVEFGWFGEPTDAQTRADMLDEGLEIIEGLWTGEPFSFKGEHYNLHEMTFRPRPVQAKIPIWVAGGWPSKRPFTRAARFDGVFPIDAPSKGFEPLQPETVAELVEFVNHHRENQEPIDTAVFFWERPGSEQADPLLSAYEEAGATWAMMSHFYDETPDEFLTRMKVGPPRRALDSKLP